MKVPASIRRLHEDQKGINDRLQRAVDDRIAGFKNPRWHYESRVKGLQSFALKVESGRYREPRALEDFFACTIVVANATEIENAERLVSDNFTVGSRRPRHADETHKAPDAFPFDDLRLYVTIPEDPALPPTDLTGVVFEVQIKTFLQHAWSIATHDLVYKTDDLNWSKQRIAYQIKAMLEHAEVSIQEAEQLATSNILAKEDPRTTAIKRGIVLMKSQWGIDELPEDVRLLATNVSDLLRALQVNVDRLQSILQTEKIQRGGAHPANLSPYCTVVQYLFNAEQVKMTELLSNAGSKLKVLIPEEIELPEGVDRGTLTNAIFVSTVV